MSCWLLFRVHCSLFRVHCSVLRERACLPASAAAASQSDPVAAVNSYTASDGMVGAANKKMKANKGKVADYHKHMLYVLAPRLSACRSLPASRSLLPVWRTSHLAAPGSISRDSKDCDGLRCSCPLPRVPSGTRGCTCLGLPQVRPSMASYAHPASRRRPGTDTSFPT